MTENPRLIELETRIAYQDEALQQLSTEVARQQQDIERLLRRVGSMAAQLDSLRDESATDGGREPPPPHY